MLRLLLTDDTGNDLGSVTITNAPTGGTPFYGHYGVTLFAPSGDLLEQVQCRAPRGHGPWALVCAALLELIRHIAGMAQNKDVFLMDDPLYSAGWAVVNHWHEFGPEADFDRAVEYLAAALRQRQELWEEKKARHAHDL